MTLTQHLNQIKLSAFVAIAAVIGGSFFIPGPAEASNGWIAAGSTSEGNSIYIKRVNRSGSVVKVKNRESGYGDWVTYTDCSTNMYKVENGNWRDIMPGSKGEFTRNQVCY